MRRNLFVFILICCTFALYGYEETRGNIKLLLDENLGTFSLYDVRNPDKPVSLLVDSDPRTSALYIFVDDRVHRMGRNSSFRQTLEKQNDGASFVWTSSSLRIIQTFSFIRSSGATVEDGILMKVKVDNLSQTAQQIGIRILLDTHRGESGGSHFTLAGGVEVARETSLSRNLPAYWVSGDPSRAALQMMVNSRGVTLPSQIVFANWKRLDSTNWVYQGRDRNFNYLPYSVNDSAVSQWYDPETVGANLSREILVALGLYTATGHMGAGPAALPSPGQAGSSEGSLSQTPVVRDNPDVFIDDLREDLNRVNQILFRIEEAIRTEEESGGVDPAELESLVRDLELRKLQYQE